MKVFFIMELFLHKCIWAAGILEAVYWLNPLSIYQKDLG